MGTIRLIQCDACRTQSESAQGWSKFVSGWKDSPEGEAIASPELDLCPRCRQRLQTAIDSILAPQSRLFANRADAPPFSETIDSVEQRHILQTLDVVEWNKSRAAELLGIERSTLDRKLKQYGATRPSRTNAQGSTL